MILPYRYPSATSLGLDKLGLFGKAFRCPGAAVPAIGVDAQLIMTLTAEQLIERLAGCLADDIPAGGFNCRQRRALDLAAVGKNVAITIRVLLLFVFRLFTPSPLCPLPSVLSLFSKKRKGNQERKTETKTPGNNVFTRKIQIQDQYKQNESVVVPVPFMKLSQTVSQR